MLGVYLDGTRRTVDYGAAVTSMDRAGDPGVTRFVIVSWIGTHDVTGAAAAMRPYLQAKRDADDALKQSGLETFPATTLPSCSSSARTRQRDRRRVRAARGEVPAREASAPSRAGLRPPGGRPA